MKKKILSRLLLAVMTVVTVFGAPIGAFAEGMENATGGLMVSPPSQKIVLVPGETYSYTVEAYNPNLSQYDIRISAEVSPYSVNKNATSFESDFETESNYTQITNWIKLGDYTETIAPGEKSVIPYTITVPEDAPAGGQYASVTISKEAVSDDPTAGAVIGEEIAIASLIYATVIGDTNESGQILSNDINTFSFDSKVTASTLVKNDGNVHSSVVSTLQIFPLFSDEEIYTNEEEPESTAIMPEQTYLQSISWTGPMAGVFKAKQTVEFAGQTAVNEKFIVICPLWLLFIIIAVIAGLIIWLVVKNKKKKN